MGAKFLLCVNDGGHPESLRTRKFYEVVEELGDSNGLIRVIDENGEDLLYPRACFIEVPLSENLETRLRNA